jgi:Flp pilus assembly protein CpaB
MRFVERHEHSNRHGDSRSFESVAIRMLMGYMSRRGRALTFLLAALAAAAFAAALANRYGSSVAQGYGALRPVVVAAAELPAGKPLDPRQVSKGLEVRRVPARFVPPGALESPAAALGLVPRAAVPAGSYLLAAQLRPPGRPGSAPGLDPSRHPVEIAVSGAGALLAAGPAPSGAKVDVVVTTEPDSGGPGRTYVAAPGVPLLDLAQGAEGEAAGTAEATLGLTRGQALKLIAAQNFARSVTLLPVGG